MPNAARSSRNVLNARGKQSNMKTCYGHVCSPLALVLLAACSQSQTTEDTSTDTSSSASAVSPSVTATSSAPNLTSSTTVTGNTATATSTGVGPTGSASTAHSSAGQTGQTDATSTSTATASQTSSTQATHTSQEPPPSGDDSSSNLQETNSATDSATSDPAVTSSDSSGFDGKELFILFGQSNMSGSSPVEEQDKTTNENITFMVEYDCPSLNQTYGEWLVAQPPLHGCQWTNNGVLGLGPADYFAKTLAQTWTTSQIGLVPCAIPGVSIDVFLKGSGPPPESYQALPSGFSSAYTMMVERAKEAQKQGRIRGILFHQGESNCGQSDWVDKVASIVSDLRTDLAIGEEVPFIAGEIPPPNSCSQSHNPKVNEIPNAIPNSAVVSAAGTAIHDQYHFDTESARLMGQRYAEAFLEIEPMP